jgi:Cu+-exporting ATPase
MAQPTNTHVEIGPIKTALEPITLSLGGMTCSSCVATIERTLNAIPGVSATVNFASETAHVMAPAEMGTKALISAIKSAGYSATEVADPSQVALHYPRSTHIDDVQLASCYRPLDPSKTR